MGRSCLPLTRPGAGAFIFELETVRNKYSTHKVRRRGRRRENERGGPVGDRLAQRRRRIAAVFEMSKILLNGSSVCDDGRIEDGGE